MNRLGLILIVSINMINAMNSENPLAHHANSGNTSLRRLLIKRAHSEPSFMSHQLPDHELNSDQFCDEESTNDSRARRDSMVRGFKITVGRDEAQPKSEANFDDVVRQIQFLSQAAMTEARTLNKQYLETIVTQLQQDAIAMKAAVDRGVTDVKTSLADFDRRLQEVEKLLPQVQKLLAQEEMLCQKYEDTCSRLRTAFEQYADNVGKKEISLIALVKRLKQTQEKMDAKINKIDARTITIEDHTRETYATVRLNLWKDRFMRNACSITTTLGVLALIIWCFSGNHHAPAIDTNASLHKIV